MVLLNDYSFTDRFNGSILMRSTSWTLFEAPEFIRAVRLDGVSNDLARLPYPEVPLRDLRQATGVDFRQNMIGETTDMMSYALYVDHHPMITYFIVHQWSSSAVSMVNQLLTIDVDPSIFVPCLLSVFHASVEDAPLHPQIEIAGGVIISIAASSVIDQESVGNGTSGQSN